MSEMMSSVDDSEDSGTQAGLDGLDDQLIGRLVDRAKAGGLQLIGEGGVLQQLAMPRSLGVGPVRTGERWASR